MPRTTAAAKGKTQTRARAATKGESPAPQKKRASKTKVELSSEEPDEETEQICHLCGQCGGEFDCPDGKFNKAGKFKCSCLKEKDGSDVFFFCSEQCLQGPSDIDEGDERAEEKGEGESDGYESI